MNNPEPRRLCKMKECARQMWRALIWQNSYFTPLLKQFVHRQTWSWKWWNFTHRGIGFQRRSWIIRFFNAVLSRAQDKQGCKTPPDIALSPIHNHNDSVVKINELILGTIKTNHLRILWVSSWCPGAEKQGNIMATIIHNPNYSAAHCWGGFLDAVTWTFFTYY